MQNHSLNRQIRHSTGIPAFVGWLAIVLWFLITIMASAKASDATIIASDLLPEIELALSEKGMSPDAAIELTDPAQPVALETGATIIHTSFNPTSGRFVTRFSSGVVVTGIANVVKQFPVLSRSLNRGDIVQENDIDYVETSQIRPGQYIEEAGALIGMEARRPLAANTPIRNNDVAMPILVKKGALITITFVLDGLRLSHQGVAMDNGGAGDVIAVKNVQSERVLKAIVERAGLARVAAPVTTLEG